MDKSQSQKADLAVTFNRRHRHADTQYEKDDVGLVTERAAKKLEKLGVAQKGGDPKTAINA